jgi:hypothetical protein
MKWMMLVVIGVGLAALANDKPKDVVDPEAYRQAMEKLALKTIAPTPTQDLDIDALRLENAALRQRISELEAMLGLRIKAANPQRQVKTFTTFQDIINTITYPADPRKEWTDLQRQKAQHDLNLSVIGSFFQATMRLDKATSDSGGFRCSFSRPGSDGKIETIAGTFDSRYSDLITSWKVGQSISFVGVIKMADVYQSKSAKGGLQVSISLSDCVPKK